MNKIISFQPQEDEPTLLQLKIIAYNIVEYAIKDAYKITDDGISPEFITVFMGKEFYCHYRHLEDTYMLKQRIECKTDYKKLREMNDNPIYDIKMFKNSYNIDNYKLSIYVFCLLHECGHMVYNQYFSDRLKNSYNKYIALQDNITSAIYMALSDNIEDGEYDNAFDYNYNPQEALATQYAYLHFKKVWDMLLNRNLI